MLRKAVGFQRLIALESETSLMKHLLSRWGC